MIRFFFKLIKWPVIIAVLLGLTAWFYPEKFLTVDSRSLAASPGFATAPPIRP